MSVKNYKVFMYKIIHDLRHPTQALNDMLAEMIQTTDKRRSTSQNILSADRRQSTCFRESSQSKKAIKFLQRYIRQSDRKLMEARNSSHQSVWRNSSSSRALDHKAHNQPPSNRIYSGSSKKDIRSKIEIMQQLQGGDSFLLQNESAVDSQVRKSIVEQEVKEGDGEGQESRGDSDLETGVEEQILEPFVQMPV